MTSISDIREKYPQYSEVSDGDLLMALHRKHYSEVHPRAFLNMIDGAANAHVTIKDPKLKEYWRENVKKPMEGEAPEDVGRRLGGEITGGDVGRGKAALHSALQGATLGFSDELMALGASIDPNVSYDQALTAYRGQMEQGRDNFPVMSTAAEIGGAMLPAAVSAPYAAGKGLLGTIGRGMGIGATEGAVYGFGAGEGKERAKSAAQFGLIGGALGGVVPAVVSGAKGAYRALTNPAGAALNIGNQARADRALSGVVARSRQSLDELSDKVASARAAGQPEYRVMDAMGKPGARLASGVARAGGDAGDDMAEFLSTRQLGQGERVSAIVDDAMGLGGKTAEQTKAVVKKNRKTVADTLFDQAAKDAKPVDVRGAVEILDDTISKMDNSGIRPPKVVREYKKLRAQLAGKTAKGEPTTLSDYESVLTLWREVRDSVDAAYRNGEGSLGEALKPVRDALQSALEESSDLYRFATDNYRVGSGVVDAFDAGQKMPMPARRAADVVDEFSGMTGQEQRAAKIGYGDKVLRDIEKNTAPTSNKAKALSSPKIKAEMAAMVDDPDGFAGKVARENEMWSTQNRALGGSLTANNLEDIDAVDGLARGAGQVARSAANFQFGDAVANIMSMVGSAATGKNQVTRKIIADALMSDDPVAALSSAIGREGREAMVQRLIEGLLRQTGRTAESRTGRVRGLLSGQ